MKYIKKYEQNNTLSYYKNVVEEYHELLDYMLDYFLFNEEIFGEERDDYIPINLTLNKNVFTLKYEIVDCSIEEYNIKDETNMINYINNFINLNIEDCRKIVNSFSEFADDLFEYFIEKENINIDEDYYELIDVTVENGLFSIYYEHDFGRDEYIIHQVNDMMKFLKNRELYKTSKKYNL